MTTDRQGSDRTGERAARADFARFRSITTRWMDNDVYGHVNNVVYYSFFDTAVNATLIDQGLLYPVSSQHICLVVETGCRYFEPLSFPEEVDAGIRVEKLGSSSARYGVGLFRKDSDLAAAQGHFVHVCVGSESRRPQPFADDMRAFLSSLIVTTS